MATVTLLNNGTGKTGNDMSKVIDYVKKEAKTSYEGKKLVTGINCPAETAYTNMMLTKNYYGKTDGRMYYHLCQSFSPDEKITPELAHKVAVEFAEKQFPEYECVVGTHVDRDHIHSHILFNSVSFTDGKKYHSDKYDIQRWRETSDEICRKYGLTIVAPIAKKDMKLPGAREFRAIDKKNSWKLQLVIMIEEAMKRARTREEFIKFMEEHGYQVTWTDTRKNITYTTPDGKKCRDNKLHEKKFLKEEMQNEFRIREELLSGKAGSEEQYISGIQADAMRNDNGTELECYGRGCQGNGKDVGRDSNERCNDRLPDSDDNDIEQQSRLVGVEGEVDSIADGRQGRADKDGSGETGWEYERAVCFGTEGVEEGNAGGFQDIYGQDVSLVPGPVPGIDLALSGARLASDIGSMIDPEPDPEPDMTSKPAHMDKKEWKKIAEKKQALGMKMGGM